MRSELGIPDTTPLTADHFIAYGFDLSEGNIKRSGTFYADTGKARQAATNDIANSLMTELKKDEYGFDESWRKRLLDNMGKKE